MSLLRRLSCWYTGHNWSAWVRVVPFDTTVSGQPVERLWHNGSYGEVRVCELGHVEWRGVDWDATPHVVTVEPAR